MAAKNLKVLFLLWKMRKTWSKKERKRAADRVSTQWLQKWPAIKLMNK